MSIRRTASCCQPRQRMSVRGGAVKGRAPGKAVIAVCPPSLREVGEEHEPEALVARRVVRDEDALVLEPHVVCPEVAGGARADVDVVPGDVLLGLGGDLGLV